MGNDPVSMQWRTIELERVTPKETIALDIPLDGKR
jgi:hypothetical protein